MIIAKINPAATKINQITPFSSTTESLEYMTAIARPYIPGATNTFFQVVYGTIEIDNESNVVSFYEKTSERISFTDEELSTWGTNDETLLTIIATKLNVSVIEFLNATGSRF
jgi:hypothetical protein